MEWPVESIVATGGPYAVIVIGIIAILRGDVIPRTTHNDIVAKRDEIITELTADRNYYRDQTLQLLRVADVAADRMTQALLTKRLHSRPDERESERGET